MFTVKKRSITSVFPKLCTQAGIRRLNLEMLRKEAEIRMFVDKDIRRPEEMLELTGKGNVADLYRRIEAARREHGKMLLVADAAIRNQKPKAHAKK